MYHVILSLLLTIQTPHESDTLARYATIAMAVDAAGDEYNGPLSKRRLVALTLATMHGESRFAKSVHAGSVNSRGSDNGQARCLSQVHPTGLLDPGEYDSIVGTDYASTLACARVTARILQRFARWCLYDGTDESIGRVISAYGTGRGCDTGYAGDGRVATMRQFERRISAENR
jgi:hypothetical protein